MQLEKKSMKTLRIFESIIIWVLIVTMALVLLVSVIQLAYTLISYLSVGTFHMLDEKVMMDLFGSILIVLIGIELLDTIKVYLRDDIVHVEIVVLVAIIALARKIIVLDFDQYTDLTKLAIGALVVGLAIAYYLIKKADHRFTFPAHRKQVKKEKAKNPGE